MSCPKWAVTRGGRPMMICSELGPSYSCCGRPERHRVLVYCVCRRSASLVSADAWEINCAGPARAQRYALCLSHGSGHPLCYVRCPELGTYRDRGMACARGPGLSLVHSPGPFRGRAPGVARDRGHSLARGPDRGLGVVRSRSLVNDGDRPPGLNGRVNGWLCAARLRCASRRVADRVLIWVLDTGGLGLGRDRVCFSHRVGPFGCPECEDRGAVLVGVMGNGGFRLGTCTGHCLAG
jgi:hypothetical protein